MTRIFSTSRSAAFVGSSNHFARQDFSTLSRIRPALDESAILGTSSSSSCSALGMLLSVSDISCTKTVGALVAYSLVANLTYLARRASLRKMTVRQLWTIRTTREEGVSRPLFLGILLAWQALVMMFPLVETIARLKGWCIFFYSYPKASGGGYILEPLDCQHLGANQRAKRQFRLDWHSFKYNIGSPGRDGYRHPPSIHRNLPHIDIPRYQVKHWPWRRRLRIADPPN